MLKITNTVFILDSQIELTAIRAQGAGGQNVNKVSTAIHLRFDVVQSSLPEEIKNKLLVVRDYRITCGGIINIKAQRFRHQEKNKEDALSRLVELIKKATKVIKKRKKTNPSKNSVKKRLDKKTKRGQLKTNRVKITKFD